MRPRHIPVGGVFGRLTTVSEPRTGNTPHYRALCRCTCGVEKSVRCDRLLTGVTRSCGCLKSEVRSAAMKRMWAEQRSDGDVEFTSWDCSLLAPTTSRARTRVSGESA